MCARGGACARQQGVGERVRGSKAWGSVCAAARRGREHERAARTCSANAQRQRATPTRSASARAPSYAKADASRRATTLGVIANLDASTRRALAATLPAAPCESSRLTREFGAATRRRYVSFCKRAAAWQPHAGSARTTAMSATRTTAMSANRENPLRTEVTRVLVKRQRRLPKRGDDPASCGCDPVPVPRGYGGAAPRPRRWGHSFHRFSALPSPGC
jgi:hypothetical protein